LEVLQYKLETPGERREGNAQGTGMNCMIRIINTWSSGQEEEGEGSMHRGTDGECNNSETNREVVM